MRMRTDLRDQPKPSPRALEVLQGKFGAHLGGGRVDPVPAGSYLILEPGTEIVLDDSTISEGELPE